MNVKSLLEKYNKLNTKQQSNVQEMWMAAFKKPFTIVEYSDGSIFTLEPAELKTMLTRYVEFCEKLPEQKESTTVLLDESLFLFFAQKDIIQVSFLTNKEMEVVVNEYRKKGKPKNLCSKRLN